MPGTDDNRDDDDGKLSYWLKYKIWRVPGWVYVLGAFGLGLLLGIL